MPKLGLIGRQDLGGPQVRARSEGEQVGREMQRLGRDVGKAADAFIETKKAKDAAEAKDMAAKYAVAAKEAEATVRLNPNTEEREELLRVQLDELRQQFRPESNTWGGADVYDQEVELTTEKSMAAGRVNAAQDNITQAKQHLRSTVKQNMDMAIVAEDGEESSERFGAAIAAVETARRLGALSDQAAEDQKAELTQTYATKRLEFELDVASKAFAADIISMDAPDHVKRESANAAPEEMRSKVVDAVNKDIARQRSADNARAEARIEQADQALENDVYADLDPIIGDLPIRKQRQIRKRQQTMMKGLAPVDDPADMAKALSILADAPERFTATNISNLDLTPTTRRAMMSWQAQIKQGNRGPAEAAGRSQDFVESYTQNLAISDEAKTEMTTRLMAGILEHRGEKGTFPTPDETQAIFNGITIRQADLTSAIEDRDFKRLGQMTGLEVGEAIDNPYDSAGTEARDFLWRTNPEFRNMPEEQRRKLVVQEVFNSMLDSRQSGRKKNELIDMYLELYPEDEE